MSVMMLILTLVVIGVLLWLINNYVPMDGKIKKILNFVVILLTALWLLAAFGIIGETGDVKVPQIQ